MPASASFKIPCLLCLLSLLALISNRQAGAGNSTFFLSPAGNDSWTGTIASPDKDGTDGPFASLTAARRAIRRLREESGITDTVEVIIAGGSYTMSEPFILRPQDSGTEDFPVVYRAAPNSTPVFMGGRVISGFVRDQNGNWTVRIPEVADGKWKFEQIFVNGCRARRAKSPNTQFYSIRDVREVVLERGTGRVPQRARQFVEVDPGILQPLKTLTKSQVNRLVLSVFHKWDFTRRFIEDIDFETNTLITSGQGMKPWNSWKKGQRFQLENYLPALDEPGEWFLEETGKFYYKPYPAEKITDTEIIAPLTNKFIIFEGHPEAAEFVSDIQIEGLSFRFSNYNSPAGGFEPSQAAYTIDAAVQLDGVKNIRIRDCEIAHCGRYAVWFRRGCSYSVIENCFLHDLGAGGIRIGEGIIQNNILNRTHHITAQNNTIRDGGRLFPPAVGIWVGHSSDNLISHNEISDLYYTGISVGWRWGYEQSLAKRNIINFNHLHHLGKGLLSDMGGIYTLGPSAGTVLDHNLIHDITAYSYGGWGIYPDEGSSDLIITNNLTYRTKTGGFHQHYGKNNLLKNNIFSFSKNYQLQCTRVEDHLSFRFRNNIVVWDEGVLLDGAWKKIHVEMDSNLYWQTKEQAFTFAGLTFEQWRALGRDGHSVIADPGFIDAKNGNYKFREKEVISHIGFRPFDYLQAGPVTKNKWANSQIP